MRPASAFVELAATSSRLYSSSVPSRAAITSGRSSSARLSPARHSAVNRLVSFFTSCECNTMTHAAAIVIRKLGPPDVLKLETIELPPLGARDLRIRMLAAAVNHSDLEIRSGAWSIRRSDPLPYVPGLEVVGDVIETGGAVDRVRVGDR